MDQTFLFHLGSHEVTQLGGLPCERVCALVVALLSQFEGHADVDDETLTSAGEGVARAGHERVDEAVLAWLETNPTDRRLEEASAFLAGYWVWARSSLETRRLERLNALMRRYDAEQVGWRFAANTLLRAYEQANLSLKAREGLRKTLVEIRENLAVTGTHPPLLARISRSLLV